MGTSTRNAVAGELRAITARRDLSQAEMAARLGVTTMWLSRRLRAAAGISVDDLTRICEVLDADPVAVLSDALAAVAPVAPATT